MRKDLPPNSFIVSAQFIEASKYQTRYWYAVIAGFFISSIISLLAIEQLAIIQNINFVIGIVVISIVIIFIGYRNKLNYRLAHSKAERLRKQSFLRDVMESAVDLEEDSYLYHSIKENVIESAKKEYEKSTQQGFNKNEYITVQRSFEGRIAESIQQNCNQTAVNLLKYYQELQRTHIPFLYLVTLFISLIILYLLINVDGSSLKIGRIFIAFISVYFSIDIFTYVETYKKESDALKELDKAIGKVKWNPSLPELLFYFSEYNSILENKPIYPYRIYRDNRERITVEWKNRLEQEIKTKNT